MNVVQIAAHLNHTGELICALAQIGSLDCRVNAQTVVHMATKGVLVPPASQDVVACSLVVEAQIELRQHIINPTLLGPEDYVREQTAVILKCIGAATAGVILLIAPYAEGADTQAYPRLGSAHIVVQLLDQQIDILTTPIAQLHTVAILCIALLVGELLVLNGIGIEIVVHMDCIYVVAGYDVAYYLGDEVAALGQTRIEQNLLTVANEPFGVLVVDVVFRQLVSLDRRNAIGVDPSVQLDVALVALVDHKLQGVPHRVGSFTCGAGQIAAPRLQLRRIEGVSRRADLPQNGIDTGQLERIDHINQISLSLLRSHCSVLLLMNGVNPRTAELTLGVLLSLGLSHESNGEHCQN